MKKLKIFLLLSILLCLGFVLSSEVHAEEITDLTGTKWLLEEGWTATSEYGLFSVTGVVYDTNDELGIENIDRFYIGYAGVNFDTNLPVPGSNRIVINYYVTFLTPANYYEFEITGGDDVTNTTLINWLETNATQIIEPSGPKPFEIGDELPVGYIKISWDFTGKPIPEETMAFMVSSGDDVFNDFIIQIHFEWGIRRVIDIYYEGSLEFLYVDTPGYTIIELTESVTITDLGGTTGATSVDYNVYIGGALTWEVVSQDYFDGFMSAREFYGFREIGGYWISGEQAWNNGYDSGSGESWDEGYEYGMETFGYYDSRTDEWLSVEEYLELYGTDKPGQSDFYNNFDKYFIPAMIIVFGGAIVLTILKVFKGRE